ncbi:MAG: DUF2750 domain-containing protein [Pseudomonadota bacterium]
MVWEPSEREIAAVLKLDAAARYDHFIKKVADTETLWGLWRDGWALSADDEAGELLPVWPHRRYASLCATDEWTEFEARAIELDRWMGRWLPGLAAERKRVAVFPTPESKGPVVDPTRLEADLRSELKCYD